MQSRPMQESQVALYPSRGARMHTQVEPPQPPVNGSRLLAAGSLPLDSENDSENAMRRCGQTSPRAGGQTSSRRRVVPVPWLFWGGGETGHMLTGLSAVHAGPFYPPCTDPILG